MGLIMEESEAFKLARSVRRLSEFTYARRMNEYGYWSFQDMHQLGNVLVLVYDDGKVVDLT
jgi:hypothetical protein